MASPLAIRGARGSEVRLEQVLPEETGHLDIVFQDAGSTVWLDFAITSSISTCTRTVQTNARKDGAAARAGEGVKRSRYHSRALPFVLEAGGRPGSAALDFTRRCAQTASEGLSTMLGPASPAPSRQAMHKLNWQLVGGKRSSTARSRSGSHDELP